MKKHIRRGALCLCVWGILLSALISCGRAVGNETADAETDKRGSSFAQDIGAEAETQIETVYRYHLYDDRVEWISEEEKQGWREPLVAFLSRLKEANWGERSASVEDTLYLERGYGVSLLDITMDGVPEVLIHLGGGSSGNAFYYIYDLYTGEHLGSLDGGHDQDFCFYYDATSGKCRLLGQYWWRMGWDTRMRYICEITPNRQENGNYDTIWMYEGCQFEMLPDETEKDGEDTAEAWVEKCCNTYELWGESVSFDDYYAEYDAFVENCSRLTQSGMQSVMWDAVEEEDDLLQEALAEKMADALLQNGQQYIRFVK